MFENFNLKEFFSAFVVLFAVIDILGSTPIFLNLRKQGKVIYPTKASVMSLVCFICFLYIGEASLKLFNIDISSFAIAGAIILFMMALEMILDVQIFQSKPELPNDATFTPVVFPLIAGAGCLTTLITMRSQFDTINILCAIFLNTVFVYLVLRFTSRLERFLGPAVIYLLQKFFGVILLAVSAKIFITNLTTLVQSLS